MLDHHKSGDDLEAIELKDVSAEATGALVVEAAEEEEEADDNKGYPALRVRQVEEDAEARMAYLRRWQ